MTFIESVYFAKVYAVAMGLAPINTITKQECDIVSEILKQMADQSPNWTDMQKETFKILVELTKPH